MSEPASGGIDRSTWVDLFEEGVKRGTRERHHRPANRTDDVTDRLEESRTEPEKDALQAGFEVGLKSGAPGQKLDIEAKANTAYDRSGYAAGLSQWGDSE